jgi:hypothetical protein
MTEPSSAETMDTASSESWNKWWSQAFDDHIGDVVGVIGDEVRKMLRKQADDVAARIDDLEQRVADLEQRLDEIQGVGKSAVPFLALKGGRNAA